MKALKRTGFFAAAFFAAIILVQFCCPARAFAKTTHTLEVRSGSDITDILQNALDLARYNPAEKYTIVVPRGKYQLHDTVKIYSNTTLSMKGVTLTRTLNDMTMLRFGRAAELEEAGGYPAYSGFQNITLEGGTWDGCSMDGAIIRAAHAQNISFKNVTFKNVKNSHHVELAACKKVKITGCTFSGFSGDKGSSTNYEALQFDIMHNEAHFAGYGKYDDTPCSNITVNGCTFKNLQRGLGSHSAVAGSYFTNAKISDNTFSNIEGYAIILTNFRSAQVSKNRIKNCGSGIFFRTMIQNYTNFYPPLSGKAKTVRNLNTKITGNTISVKYSGYKNTAFGIQLYGEVLKSVTGPEQIPAGDYQVSGVTVSNNTISLSCLGYGIWLQGTARSQVTGNTIISSITDRAGGSGLGDGIRMENSPDNKIIGNKITNKKTSVAKEACGIFVRPGCTKTTVQGNTVSGASKYGIGLQEKCEGTIVKSNQVMNSSLYGIGVWCPNTTIQGNTISGSGSSNLGISASVKSQVKDIGNKLL